MAVSAHNEYINRRRKARKAAIDLLIQNHEDEFRQLHKQMMMSYGLYGEMEGQMTIDEI